MQCVATACSSSPRHLFNIWRSPVYFPLKRHDTYNCCIQYPEWIKQPNGIDNSYLPTLLDGHKTRGPTAQKVDDCKLPSLKRSNRHCVDGIIRPPSCFQRVFVAPTALLSHAACVINDELYVFGGISTSGVSNCLWKLSYKDEQSGDCKWRMVYSGMIKELDQVPSPRFGHTINAYNNKLVITGGRSSDRRKTMDCYTYCTVTNMWQRIELSGNDAESYNHINTQNTHRQQPNECRLKNGVEGLEEESLPPARSGHTTVVYDNSLWVYGGWNGEKQLSDLWRYDFIAERWCIMKTRQSTRKIRNPNGFRTNNCNGSHSITTTDHLIPLDKQSKSRVAIHPGPRHWHIACVWNHNMFIHGGLAGEPCLDNIWQYNFKKNDWQQIHTQTPTGLRLARCRHVGFVVSNSWIIQGGRNSNGHVFSMPCEYSFDHRRWRPITVTPSRQIRRQLCRAVTSSSVPNLTAQSDAETVDKVHYSLPASQSSPMMSSYDNKRNGCSLRSDLWCKQSELQRLTLQPHRRLTKRFTKYHGWLLPHLHGHAIAVDSKSGIAFFISGCDDGSRPSEELLIISFQSILRTVVEQFADNQTASGTSPLMKLFSYQPYLALVDSYL